MLTADREAAIREQLAMLPKESLSVITLLMKSMIATEPISMEDYEAAFTAMKDWPPKARRTALNVLDKYYVPRQI